MDKYGKIPVKRLQNYTELLFKLKLFTDEDKKEIYDKINSINK